MTSQSTPAADDVILDVLKEHHGDWFVEYNCATRHMPFAVLNVIFMKRAGESSYVRQTMAEQLADWLKRYPVPVMVYGIDEKEDTIRFGNDGKHMLSGYLDSHSKQVVSQWGLIHEKQFPAEQITPESLQRAYAGVPFRRKSVLKAETTNRYRRLKRGAHLVLFFFVVVPVLLELIALGVTWLGHTLAAISILAGLYKIGKTFGWLRPSERAGKDADEELQMRHHHYHCLRNPRAFEQLRAENYARDTAEKLQKESDALATAQCVRG